MGGKTGMRKVSPSRWKQTLIKAGLLAPDTPFNRRASEYAEHAQSLEWATKKRERAKAKEPAE